MYQNKYECLISQDAKPTFAIPLQLKATISYLLEKEPFTLLYYI